MRQNGIAKITKERKKGRISCNLDVLQCRFSRVTSEKMAAI